MGGRRRPLVGLNAEGKMVVEVREGTSVADVDPKDGAEERSGHLQEERIPDIRDLSTLLEGTEL